MVTEVSVEQVAVMGNQEQRACEDPKVLLEPFDRRHVEVVCRLVEQQDIGFGHEYPCEFCADFPSSGEVSEWVFEACRVESKSCEYCFRSILEFVSTQVFVFGLQGSKPGERGLVMASIRTFCSS